MIQYIKERIFGRAATGIPLSHISKEVHTVLPDRVATPLEMHLVIHTALQEVQRKMKEAQS